MRCTNEVKRSLFIAGNHTNLDTRTLLDFQHCFYAVFRVAQRCRCESRDFCNAEAREKLLEFLQYINSLIDSFLLHLSIFYIRSQAYHMLFLHQKFNASFCDLINRHTHRIRANINNCMNQRKNLL